MVEISGFHAHVYFDAGTIETARKVCEAAARLLPVKMGRIHEQSVGPHPMCSCQLAFAPENLGEVLSWLALHRENLIVFTHPETGDHLADHRDHAIWMGQVLRLNLDVFEAARN